MIRKSIIFTIVLTLAGVIYAQENKSVKLNGYLIDNMCASHHVADANFGEKVKEHTPACAMMAGCERSGFAVFADGKLYKFDQTGNDLADKIVHATKRKKGLPVAVEGTIEGDTLHVTGITEVADEKSEK